ncbi:NIPSNAP family protein [Devosia nitrariae]|uniref:NIPSNAP family protein n=1 Tax=Devosia nitrariae TaxID=2071872 RepID=A0ABQ5WAX9_9HYPH|nr:NIPSNAP family protein [Devosia nitrariae]GLQ57275.1 NIPSNAP family protein [Devosia nitrariae]
MILETWVYRCLPGRLPALLARFENATIELFHKHGFKPLGFFTTLAGPSHQSLTYHLQWDSLEQRERCWASFIADPEWHKALAESEKDGPLLVDRSNTLLRPTSFSPMR